MIDAVHVPTSVHFTTGSVVLVTTLTAFVVTAGRAYRRLPLRPWVHGAMIIAQVALAVQALIGIKLLDQGLGPLQLYIHYVGGLGPLFFFLLYYWLPASFRAWRGAAPLITGLAFVFAAMAFGIGESYEPGL